MLTSNQLNGISRHLIANGISYQEVHDELFDHFVSAIETTMEESVSFDDALAETMQRFNGKKGLITIQRNRYKAAQKQYQRQIFQLIGSCFRWPSLLLTITGIFLVYTGIVSAPNMMFIAYGLMGIAMLPFILNCVVNGRFLWTYFRRKHTIALSLEGFTLLHRSLGLILAVIYPNLLVWGHFIKPKNAILNPAEQIIFFVLSLVLLLTTYAVAVLSIRYASGLRTINSSSR